MKPLSCGHVAIAGDRRVCRHLAGLSDTDDVGFFRFLVGDGMRWEFRCRLCVDDSGSEAWEVCEGCVTRVEEDQESLGWRGELVIEERLEPCDQTVVATPLPGRLRDVVDIAPVAAQPGVWLVLGRDGLISRWDTTSGSCTVQAKSRVPDESSRRPWTHHVAGARLHVSADGRFVAVVNDFGRHGAVFDLAAAAPLRRARWRTPTMVLDGGGYHEKTVPLSFAFAEHRGRTVAIHRTAWNRLDVSDPATGALLTERDFGPWERGGPHPAHYIDYFHGALLVSPNGSRVADDGWVWTPVGIPTAWSLERWLDGDVWESEDGPSRFRLAERWSGWNNPMCWLDDDHLAIWGVGDDYEEMLDGVEIFSAGTGARTGVFVGPRGLIFADRRRLYSASPDGLEVWDPATGHRTGSVPGFVPTHHHVGSSELAVLEDGVLRRWSTSSCGAS